MRKVYLVCPKCGISNEGWESISRDIVRNNWLAEGDDLEIINEECIESEHIVTRHSCDFESHEYLVEDFAILVEDGIVKCVGYYWYDNLEELKKLIEYEINDNVDIY